APLRALTTTLAMHEPHLSLRNCLARWLPPGLTIPLRRALPSQTELVAVGVGRTAWVTIPGELQSELGELVRQSGRPVWGPALAAGVSNDYLGYFLTARNAATPSYVACAAVYGPVAGQRIAHAAIELMRRLAGGGSR